jgi:DNA modification methylase
VTAPEPYYSGRGVTLHLGRCEDVLPHLSGVQLTVTSPPYNTNGGATGTGGRVTGTDTTKTWRARIRDQFYDDDLPEPDYRQQQATVAKLLAGASTPDAALFYNHKVRYRSNVPLHPLDIVRTFDGWSLRQEVIWCRPGGITHQGGMFVAADERVYWLVRDLQNFRCSKRASRWITWWQMNPPNVGRLDHPVPFPAAIPERAILTATEPGHVVLDPYAGSGTTLRVAKVLGRRAVGIEAHEPYAQACAEMLEAL